MGSELLTALAIALPALAAAVCAVRRARRLATAMTIAAPVPALALAIAPAAEPLAVPILFTGLSFELDEIGRVFLFFTAALWLLAGVYARSYTASDPRQGTFFLFWALTMAGNVGLVLAADVLSFYFAFVLMTFAAYGLVVHVRGERERRAGRVYLVMAMAGEILLLAGLWTAVAAAGFAPGFDDVVAGYIDAPFAALTAGCFLLGFAVKAGFAPLHVWLPLAHPVAPTPASALLSGAMIKAGLLGWIRFLPVGELALPGWGAAWVAGGIAAAFFGVAMGFTQDEPKTVLAYSSISQMGYMAVGTGIALLSPAHATGALLATAYYAAHHAAAKGALFLAVGLAPSPDARFRRRVLIYTGAALPALALAGAPLTSGATAKFALKEAAGALPDDIAALVPVLLAIAAVGTTLLLARFVVVLPRAAANRQPAAPAPGTKRQPAAPAPGTQRQPAAPVPGMIVPWVLMLGLGLTATLWLPWIYAPPPGLPALSPMEDLVAAIWPIALGVVLASGIWRFHHRMPHLASLRVPPGDLVILGEAFARRLIALHPANVLFRLDRQARRAVLLSHRITVEIFAGGATRDVYLARGIILGTLIFIVLAALMLALVLTA